MYDNNIFVAKLVGYRMFVFGYDEYCESDEGDCYEAYIEDCFDGTQDSLGCIRAESVRDAVENCIFNRFNLSKEDKRLILKTMKANNL